MECEFTNRPESRAWLRSLCCLSMLPMTLSTLHAFLVGPSAVRLHAPQAPHARHAPVVARTLNFVATLEVKTSPFAASSPSVGEWFASEEALTILMSQAESARRLTVDEKQQRWLVTTPCVSGLPTRLMPSSQFLTRPLFFSILLYSSLFFSGSSFLAWSHVPRRSWISPWTHQHRGCPSPAASRRPFARAGRLGHRACCRGSTTLPRRRARTASSCATRPLLQTALVKRSVSPRWTSPCPSRSPDYSSHRSYPPDRLKRQGASPSKSCLTGTWRLCSHSSGKGTLRLRRAPRALPRAGMGARRDKEREREPYTDGESRTRRPRDRSHHLHGRVQSGARAAGGAGSVQCERTRAAAVIGIVAVKHSDWRTDLSIVSDLSSAPASARAPDFRSSTAPILHGDVRNETPEQAPRRAGPRFRGRPSCFPVASARRSRRPPTAVPASSWCLVAGGPPHAVRATRGRDPCRAAALAPRMHCHCLCTKCVRDVPARREM